MDLWQFLLSQRVCCGQGCAEGKAIRRRCHGRSRDPRSARCTPSPWALSCLFLSGHILTRFSPRTGRCKGSKHHCVQLYKHFHYRSKSVLPESRVIIGAQVTFLAAFLVDSDKAVLDSAHTSFEFNSSLLPCPCRGHLCIVTELLGQSLYHAMKSLPARKSDGMFGVSLNALRHLSHQLCHAMSFCEALHTFTPPALMQQLSISLQETHNRGSIAVGSQKRLPPNSVHSWSCACRPQDGKCAARLSRYEPEG